MAFLDLLGFMIYFQNCYKIITNSEVKVMSDAIKAKLEEFPVFARHMGVWEGTYTRMDARTGEILDRHRSRFTCKILEDGSYWQQNEYFWDDGKKEVKVDKERFVDLKDMMQKRYDDPKKVRPVKREVGSTKSVSKKVKIKTPFHLLVLKNFPKVTITLS
ncbi:MAG: hypothetical protein ACK419_04020 [Pyrinomonadaceae bacterium]